MDRHQTARTRLRLRGLGVLGALLMLGALVGCGSNGLAAVQPMHGDPGSPSLSLEGTIEEIHFQNINKAQGRYTYNVELRVAHDGIPDSPYELDHVPGLYRVKVHKVYWSELDAAGQARVAPDGPQHVMSVERWQSYAVGQRVSIEVATWGPGHGVPKALGVPTSPAQ